MSFDMVRRGQMPRSAAELSILILSRGHVYRFCDFQNIVLTVVLLCCVRCGDFRCVCGMSSQVAAVFGTALMIGAVVVLFAYFGFWLN
jgi:hypothetical protein